MSLFMIEDFIASYPDVDSKNLQTLLTAKRELNELAPPLLEPLPGRGEFYKPQELFKRITIHYEDMLLMARTGTGKSISMINLSESLHQIVEGVRSAMDSIPHIHRAFFLVKGQILAEEFKNQLVFKGTASGTYDVESVINAKTSTSQRTQITKKIKDWWEVDHFQSFANKIGALSDEEIIEQYSGSLFFVDEVHYLKNPFLFSNTEFEVSKKPKKQSKKGENNGKTYYNVYKEFWRLFHLVKRKKIILASATLMINKPSELIDPLNLLLPEDNQIADDQFDWDVITLPQLYPYIAGKVSFVRELDTGVQLVYNGLRPNITFQILDSQLQKQTVKFQTTIHFTQMSQFQNYNYNRAPHGNYDINPRNASCFVFPDGSWGGDFERNTRKAPIIYTANGKKRGPKAKEQKEQEDTEEELKAQELKLEKKQQRQNLIGLGITGYVESLEEDSFKSKPEFKEYLKNFQNIRKSSCKYADILVRYSPTLGGGKPKNPGSVFIYSSIKSGSGAFVLGLCLEAHGFTRYMNTSSVFSFADKKITIEKAPRYAMITGETPASRKASILELFNSWENRHGEYIKILIGNETTQAGISLSNVINFDLTLADWHSAGIYQSISRILRATSHVDLSAENPGVPIMIQIYFHASLAQIGEYRMVDNLDIAEFKYNSETRQYSNGTIIFKSIDLDLYIGAEVKNHKIKRVERFLVQSAVDAQINEFRNHRSTDQDYTEICYYDKCDYKFSDPTIPGLSPIVPLTPETYWDNLKNPVLDTSTFDIYYSGEVIKYLTIELIGLFRTIDSIMIYDLLVLPKFEKFPEKYIWMTLNQIIHLNPIMYNKFGVRVYLHTQGQKIWTSAEIFDNSSDIYYSTFLSIDQKPFENFIIEVDAQQTQISKSILRSFNQDDFNKLDLEKKVSIFEEVFIKYLQDGNLNPAENQIFLYFKANILSFNIPTNILQEINLRYGAFRKTRKDDSKFLLTSEEEEKLLLERGEQKTPSVYVHWIYNRNNGNYNIAFQLNTISKPLRLYDLQMAKWRDLTTSETKIYSFLIEEYIRQKLEPFKEKIYSFIDYNGSRRIVDDRMGNGKNSGQLCESLPKDRLLEYIISSGYPGDENELKFLTVQELCKLYTQMLQESEDIFDYRTLDIYKK